jgi:hypothetical protein
VRKILFYFSSPLQNPKNKKRNLPVSTRLGKGKEEKGEGNDEFVQKLPP